MPRTAPALILAMAACMLAATIPAPAAAQAPGWQPAPLLVAQKHRARANGRKIACTPFGCHRIPLGCYPEPDFDMWGNPTGYDRVICPRR